MKQTDNLKLNIIEGTDIPSHSVFNENFNKLDNLGKDTNDKINSLETSFNTMLTDISSLTEEQITQNNVITKNTNDILDLETKVEVIENNLNKTTISVNGEDKTGILHRVKMLIKEKDMSVQVARMYAKSVGDNEDEKRISLSNINTAIAINVTENLNIKDTSNIVVLGCTAYVNEYVTPPKSPYNTLSFRVISKQYNTDDIYIALNSNVCIANLQTYTVQTGWLPQPTLQYGGDLTVEFNYIVLD